MKIYICFRYDTFMICNSIYSIGSLNGTNDSDIKMCCHLLRSESINKQRKSKKFNDKTQFQIKQCDNMSKWLNNVEINVCVVKCRVKIKVHKLNFTSNK